MKLFLALAAMLFWSTMAVAQDLPETTSELFQLSEQDYSIGALERIFGGIVSYVVDGDAAAAENGSLISSAIGILNIVVMAIAVVIGLYSVLSLTADTASDGTALGRSTDTKYTFLRAGTAAIFLLPIKGGFTVIQLIAIYLMVWGAGLADTTWKFVAEKTLNAESYVGPANIDNDEGWRMRGEVANATLGIVSGELCARHLRRLASTLGVNGGAGIVAEEFTKGTDASGMLASQQQKKYLEVYWKSEVGSRNSKDICGNVRYSIAFSGGVPETAFQFNPAQVNELQEKLSVLAQEDVYQSTKSALLNIVIPRARALAAKIDSGSGDGLRNDGEVQNELRAIAEAATSAIFTSRISDTTFSDAEINEIKTSLVDSVTENGWMRAASWQRGLSNIFTRLKDIRNSLSFEVNMDNRIGRLFGTGTFSVVTSYNTVSRAAFEPVERDFDYLSTFRSYIAKLHLPDPDGGSSSLGQDAGDDIVGQYLSEIYKTMLWFFTPDTGEATYQDPFIGYADTGSSLVAVGGGIYAAVGAAQAAADGAGDSLLGLFGGKVATNVLSFALEGILLIAKYLFAVGMIFMVIILTIPMIYFLSASITWLGLCMEAMFALPLAVLVGFAPAREPSFLGPWNKVVMTMFGLLLRPFFAVVGLLACIIILWIGGELLGILFGQLLGVLAPDWGMMSAIMMLGLIGVYAMTLTFLAMHASSMITALGDGALGWLGVQVSAIGRDGIAEGATQSGKGQAIGQAPSGNMLGGGAKVIGIGAGKGAGHIKGLISSSKPKG